MRLSPIISRVLLAILLVDCKLTSSGEERLIACPELQEETALSLCFVKGINSIICGKELTVLQNISSQLSGRS